MPILRSRSLRPALGHSARRLSRAAPALALAAWLAGCASSPPVHYYTLQGPSAPAPAVPRAAAPFLIDVQGVNVAAQADQPQLMVRTGDGSVSALYSERWSSPLGDEIRGALSDALKHDLGALDVQVVKPAPTAPVWRIQTDVQRFDLVAGRKSQLDATWRVRPVNLKGNGLLCRSVVTVNVSDAAGDSAAGGSGSKPAPTSGVPGLVAAQQRAVVALAGAMASAIRGQTPDSGGGVQMLGCSPLPD
ncbi:membrane integrity-associated transporter subunit PqiC [Achromobacter sp. DH1f]|uniref:PqiC family protein n=1 Tax=Achromobacter sp. DH1f TaxID=1397275 RepID=UPI00068DA6F0|nr:PqiC family protein [Achromobacter sp. DH1f]